MIRQIAESLLRRSNVAGYLPTDVEVLIAASEIENVGDPQSFLDRFIAGLRKEAVSVFLSAWEKVRGIADLRTRAIYIPGTTNFRRKLWAKTHELGHHVLPWQQVNTAYRDDSYSLSPDAAELFDQEANLFAAEIIFQGERFAHRARQFTPTFDAVFGLADEHGASRHATLWRFVEDQDEVVAAATYWPSRYALDRQGFPVLRRGKVVGSPRFQRRFHDIALPAEFGSEHPWAAARACESVCTGDIALTGGGMSVRFQWQSWWNRYALFVMLRRRPQLALVGHLINS
ncbi:MAG TPA: ImmA/IrrE family metallo-endopeptidase [Thermoanaerobaculia bacterium]|nr:ImmA/IrrE family metallo-endopeptidase [Thermoanaerobaculia bacterium]